ncbi:asparagine synthetase B family protein [Novispirillum itersonii]|uniref:asparagine synthetase B family protein n=1 Tax=Novispirillum itersonii TaxID=189 RepID=UPI00037B756D|nr:asparagine synthase-related protein [Novispirillum itersonii]
MTAIAGIWQHDGGGADVSRQITRMGAALAPYGRDGEGSCEIKDAGLALTCRMSHTTVTDTADRQPLWDDQRSVCVVADARIDNTAELAAGLGWTVREAEGRSDAALILAAYHRWGPDCVDRLTGDFAFALWDRQAQHLLLARDAIGSRPLFFTHRPGLFAFASMPKGLFAADGVSRALDPLEVGCYLALVPQVDTKTLYRDLSRVPPGHYLLVRGDHHRMVRYWPGPARPGSRPASRPASHRGDYHAYLEEFRRLYAGAVGARLRALPGTEIGSYLSAGFDSSSVTALAATALAGAGGGLTAFTGAPRQGFSGAYSPATVVDESVMAAEVARRYANVRHHIVRPGPVSLLDCLDRKLPHLEMPFRNAANIAWMEAIQRDAAGQGITVLLSGALGNLTSSYSGTACLPRLLRQGRWHTLAAVAAGMRAEGVGWRRLAALTIGPYLPDRLRRLRRLRRRNAVFAYSALSPEFAAAIDLPRLAAARGRSLSAEGFFRDSWTARFRALRQNDPGVYHHATLAEHGIDTRDPTSDRRLMEFCLTVPDDVFIQGGRQASLLRDAMDGLLPEALLARRIQGLQAADWYEGLIAHQAGIVAELDRLDGSPLARQVLDLARLRRMMACLPPPGAAADPAAIRYLVSSDGTMGYCLALLRGLSVGRFIRMVEEGG